MNGRKESLKSKSKSKSNCIFPRGPMNYDKSLLEEK